MTDPDKNWIQGEESQFKNSAPGRSTTLQWMPNINWGI